MSFLVYLLKVTITSGILFGYYRLFLCNKKFHHYNRFFLIGALLLSIVLPFIRIPLLYEPENPVNKAVYHTVSVINTDYYGPEAGPEEAASFSETVFTVMNTIYLLYVIGAVILLTLIARSLIYILSIRRKYAAENITSLKFYNTHEPGTPFSFFRSIFWNDQLKFNSPEGQQIFRHELFHVQHHHSADRLLAELVTAVFWFNPFFHLIKRELRAIHEFLADQFAINNSDRYTYATLLVQQALELGKHRVTNHFFQNQIKRRIAMITQFKQSNYGYWSRVMILPVSILLFCFITLYAEKPAIAQTTSYNPAEKSTASLGDNKPGIAKSGEQTAFHFKTPLDAGKGSVTDTIPERERKLRQENELMKMEMKMKVMEREAAMKKVRQAQLDELKQQMKAQEQMEQKVTENKQLHEKRMLAIEKVMKDREIVMEKKHEARLEELKLTIRKMELDKNENPEAKKIRDARLDELKKKIQNDQRELQEQRADQQKMLKQRMMELESMHDKLSEDQKKQREEMMNMRKKFQEREMDLKKQHQEEMRKQREELRKFEKDQKEKENKEQLSGIIMKPNFSDSLLRNVIRQYNRAIRYPQAALNHEAQGQVYFSVMVDKEGVCKDFKTYQLRPAAEKIQDLVIVARAPVAVTEPDPNLDVNALFASEMKRATDHLSQKPIAHPEDRTYYFRAIFKIEDWKDKNISLTSNSKKPGSPFYAYNSPDKSPGNPFQDTIPGKRAKADHVAPGKKNGEVIKYRVSKDKPAKPGEEVIKYRVTKEKPAKPKTAKPPVIKKEKEESKPRNQ